jgi:hypothetical protein
MTLDDYRKFLAASYHPGVPMDEVSGHYFRIYGRGNTYEKTPLLANPREKDEKAVDFLMRIFGKHVILNALRAMEEELGIKASQWQATKKQPKSFEKIEDNERIIKALKQRLEAMMTPGGNPGMEFLGFGTDTCAQVAATRRSIRQMTMERDRLKARIDNLRLSNQNYISEVVREDFTQLAEFFPDTNLRAFEEIEEFHVRIREILREETEEEIVKLEPVLRRRNAEIERLRTKIESAGIASDLTQQVLSQCVSISKRIDALEAENRELEHEKELQEERVLAERRMERLIADQKAAIDEVVSAINLILSEMNQTVTGDTENPPTLAISNAKEISFGTAGNTSEGTACKSLVLYDLAVLALTGIPTVIHDGNILHSISRDHFERLLTLYESSGKQIFIAADRAESEILKETTVLHLSEEHRLFGFSWGRKEAE